MPNNTTSKEEVKKFLDCFKIKMKIFGILNRDDRNKNLESLSKIEISPKEREEIIKSLEVIDFCDGPNIDILNGSQDLWVFGKKFKNKEIYIKVSLGFDNCRVVCVSFHPAENAMIFPLRV